MTDHTPEPCECRVTLTEAGTYLGAIIYCPTHAAAFENAERLASWEHRFPAGPEVTMMKSLALLDQNADLLAALEEMVEVMDDLMPHVDVVSTVGARLRTDNIDAVLRRARAAIAKAKGDTDDPR